MSRVVAAARRHGAAILAVPVGDTIKRVAEDGRILETPPRASCWAAQTPQVFRVEILREALAKAAAEGRLGTDDAETRTFSKKRRIGRAGRRSYVRGHRRSMNNTRRDFRERRRYRG